MLLLTAAVAPAARAQDYDYAPARAAFSQQQLDQLLAPIALYPDPLLSQILMAATYPRDVREAAQWSRDHPGAGGESAMRAVDYMDWDPSVKSLVAVPQVLAMMDEHRDWTEDLGDAFLDQQPLVMDSIQYLRWQAYDAGNLASDDDVRVDVEGQFIAIDSADPQFMYAPCYDPLFVYGAWRWTAYPPLRIMVSPGYAVRPGYAAYARVLEIRMPRARFFGAFDWRQHHASVVNVNNYNRPVGVERSAMLAPAATGTWRHEPARDTRAASAPATVAAYPPARVDSYATHPMVHAPAPPEPQRAVRVANAPAIAAANPTPRADAYTAHPRAAAAPDTRWDARANDRHESSGAPPASHAVAAAAPSAPTPATHVAAAPARTPPTSDRRDGHGGEMQGQRH